jgi:hypothetical protein
MKMRILPAVILIILVSKLGAADQLNYDLFKRNYEQAVEGTRFPGEYFQITQLSGIQQDIAGYDPDRSLASQGEGSSELDGPAWRHPKFTAAAEAAYAVFAAEPIPKLG